MDKIEIEYKKNSCKNFHVPQISENTISFQQVNCQNRKKQVKVLSAFHNVITGCSTNNLFS